MSTFVPVVSARTPSASWFAELFLALGPEQLAGESAKLPNTPWLIVMNAEDRVCQLWQFNTALQTWARVFVPGHPQIDQPLPAGTRRISLCFDQAERPIVAFEQSETIFVTRWDAVQQEYIQNVSFPGTDPVVVLDATWSGDLPGSDVLLFYLSTDRERVLARVQRELFATINTIWDYGEPVILDRVIPAPLRYQVLVSDASGAMLDEVLLSDLYPYGTQDFVVALGQPPVGGVYMGVVLNAGEFLDAMSATGLPPSGGAYAEAIELLEFGPDDVSATGLPPTGGAYAPAVEYVEPDADTVTATGLPPTGGEIVNVTIHLPNEHLDELEVTALPPSGGTYELA